MRWERFFEDLEDQLAAEWEAERAALDSEAERVRVSRLELRARLVALVQGEPSSVSIALSDGSTLDGAPSSVGADWMALRVSRAPARESIALVPLRAVRAIGAAHGEVLRSARTAGPESRLAQRVTFGFALRDLARRRVPVMVGMVPGRVLPGTIDRVGADHLDIALHDAGSPRRAAEVRGYRIVAFDAVAWVRVDAAAGVMTP
ncbi:hypothetical protein N8K70_05980 [Microbacterium betulae]|uniref:Uncharacterized protein n=1 Tax=Microbacterium betulae TaxID=2981139 RepID=A0AA97FMN4_9MICO|nr:hypothetical protein [Microbacterium sp. AB]WOF24217.1 hypothetical protein N8K70_05980 [Microbacterium sp. AB]